MLRGSRQLVTDLLPGSRACRQLITRKLTTPRGSYEELVPVELGLKATVVDFMYLTPFRNESCGRTPRLLLHNPPSAILDLTGCEFPKSPSLRGIMAHRPAKFKDNRRW